MKNNYIPVNKPSIKTFDNKNYEALKLINLKLKGDVSRGTSRVATRQLCESCLGETTGKQ